MRFVLSEVIMTVSESQNTTAISLIGLVGVKVLNIAVTKYSSGRFNLIRTLPIWTG